MQQTLTSKYTWLQHLIFWVFIVLFIADYYLEYYSVVESLLWALAEVFFYAAASYFNYGFLIPRLLQSGRRIAYFASIAGMLMLAVLFFKWTGLSTHFYGGNSLRYDFSALINFGLFTFISSMVWYQQQFYKSRQQQIETQKDKLETELQFLKAQISPHFLFNSLNNIYSLCLQKDENAAPMVAKLSQIMRYVLDSSAAEKVPLQGEMDFLQDYIDLQLLKKTKSENVDFYMEGIEAAHQIAPLLLINFIENAFKFSGIYQNENAWIEVSCSVAENEQLHFQVANSQQNPSKAYSQSSNSSIGIQNVQRQLALHYPNRHELKVEEKEDIFRVDLKINLIL